MIEQVLLRLECFGFPVRDAEREALEQAVEAAREEICNTCNLAEVPEGLKFYWIERSCVKYLRGLGLHDVKMGEVTMKFDDVYPTTARFRKMVW